jgi:hypothetical protein
LIARVLRRNDSKEDLLMQRRRRGDVGRAGGAFCREIFVCGDCICWPVRYRLAAAPHAHRSTRPFNLETVHARELRQVRVHHPPRGNHQGTKAQRNAS